MFEYSAPTVTMIYDDRSPLRYRQLHTLKIISREGLWYPVEPLGPIRRRQRLLSIHFMST